MKGHSMPSLDLQVEEIETRERGGGSCTSSTTSSLCTCLCKIPQTTSLGCGTLSR